MPQKLIPLIEYAEQQGIPESTLRWQIKQGQQAAVRHGRYWYIPVEVEKRSQDTQVFTLFTHAGGAGKTSLARDLGFALASRGYRVLLIDADPQANLTAWLGVDPTSVSNQETLLAVVENDQLLPAPRTGLIGGLELIPANMNLALAEVIIPSKTLGMLPLRTTLHDMEWFTHYDYILIDSPPSLGPLAGMAALASHGLIVPVETSAKGMQALRGVVEIARDYVKRLASVRFLSPKTQFVRMLVPTKYDPRTNQDRQAQQLLEEAARIAPVSPPLSYRPAPYKEAMDQCLPIQAVGDQKLLEEMEAVCTAFIRQTQPEAASLSPQSGEVA